MIKHTFTMIKPDATRRNVTGYILSKLENIGKIVEMRMHTMTKQEAETFYNEHKERPFFSTMIKEITSGQVCLIKLEGDDNIVSKTREIIGATNPKEAAPGTIRNSFGENLDRNSIHGSDSDVSAVRELKLFF